MNRKDFELIARSVKSMKFLGHLDRLNVAEAHATDFEKAGGCAGFDRGRFLKACGVLNGAS